MQKKKKKKVVFFFPPVFLKKSGCSQQAGGDRSSWGVPSFWAFNQGAKADEEWCSIPGSRKETGATWHFVAVS